MTTGTIRRLPDGELYMDDQATALLFGVDVDTITFVSKGSGRAAMNLPDQLRKAGIRRRKEYEAMTGDPNPDMLGCLVYHAHLEGIGLVYDNGEGDLITLVEPTNQEDQ